MFRDVVRFINQSRLQKIIISAEYKSKSIAAREIKAQIFMEMMLYIKNLIFKNSDKKANG